MFSLLIFLGLLLSCDPVEPPVVQNVKLSISSITKFEGDNQQAFTFKLQTSASHESQISIDYKTQDITAQENLDYLPISGKFTLPAGERSGEIIVQVVGDSIKEQDETFKLLLSNPINVDLISNEAIGTIKNDDTFIDIPADGYSTPLFYGGYNLVWNDEFDESTINSGNWTHEMGDHGWGNNESQYYTDREENSFISDGTLVIEAREDDYNGSDYTSARMISRDKKEFMYGRIDIRAILPKGQGIWPALWMLGGNFDEIGWSKCGEIDIMEVVGHEPNRVHGTAHWGEPHQQYGGSIDSNEQLSESFNVYSIIWDGNEIKWSFNDQVYHVLNTTGINPNNPFNQPFFFIFNVAVGGNWPGYPDETTQFPQRMIVDYIRVFQKN